MRLSNTVGLIKFNKKPEIKPFGFFFKYTDAQPYLIPKNTKRMIPDSLINLIM